ncbi:hypothetical protein MOQ72_29060 [Saccharopolyspora sp. K220]|uniref:hypothetical protein n=1 Tax=Saccharopolyspora soli TaxID=2926618 RepID=UPI001F5709AE|nr:hypothetical protein [Saccharopolyspora soli]MCI2421491.1 hypothetical protein [Saccharopolyspora soli]
MTTIPPQLDKRRLAAGVVKANTPSERRRATLYVAGRARDATDLAQVLDALGLTPADTRQEVPA